MPASKVVPVTVFLLLMLGVSGCAGLWREHEQQHTGSVVDYLYPDATQAPQLQAEVTRLHPPVRVGIAFVPGCSCGDFAAADQQKLLERVRSAFTGYGYLGEIQVIPGSYLRARGGFANLDQVARMFNLEVIALVSYDQTQFNDSNALAVLYWTVVGAYVIRGDHYDVHTLVDTAVFDIATHTLLFRAPGSSQIKGNASMNGFSERSRVARGEGYAQAVDQMIPALQAELEQFKERAKTSTAFKIENKPGYNGAGEFDGSSLAIVLMLGGIAYASRRNA